MKRDLAALAGRRHDLLIVGGGVYGAAAAWEAARRGLGVALLERDDFGSGTSWNSLKTIHGGLRHLQRAELSLLRESASERRTLLRIAPQLVRPLRFLVPTRSRAERELLRMGLVVNDLLAGDRDAGLPEAQRIPRSRVISAWELRELAPELVFCGTRGAAFWTDAQVLSSERLVVAFLHAAAEAGAMLANYAEVTGFLRSGARVTGARVFDREGGRALEVEARLVLNAAGPWCDDLIERAGIARRRLPLLRAMNLVLRRPVVTRYAVGAKSDGRFLFVVPWRDRAIVGTDYEPAEAPARENAPEAFCERASRAFPWAAIASEDIALVHLGLVPGSGGADGLFSRSLVIDHEAEDGVPGLVSALGAKYTTARAVGEKAVSLVCERLGHRGPPRTAPPVLPRAALLAGAVEDQARLAAREEMAVHLADAVLRRLELGTAEQPSEADVEAAARGMGTELGWDEARRRREREALETALSRHRVR